VPEPISRILAFRATYNEAVNILEEWNRGDKILSHADMPVIDGNSADSFGFFDWHPSGRRY